MKHLILFGIFTLLLIGCKSNQATQKITDGKYCYHATDDESLFLQIEFKGKNVKGRIFEEEEALGKRYYDFRGTVLNDSTLKVEIRSYPEDISEQWNIHYTEKGLVLSGFFTQTHIFVTIDCEKMPDLSNYASFAKIMKESEMYDDYEEDGEYNENNSVTETLRYYESYNPNASAYKRIQTVEYTALWFNDTDDEFGGKSVGYSEGDPEWTSYFSGTKKDRYYNVTIRTTIGKEQIVSEETWIFNEDKEKFNIQTQDEKRLGNTFFRVIDIADIPEVMMKKLER